MMVRMRRLSTLLQFGIGCTLLGAAAALMAEPAAQLTMAWRDKPPYHYLENGVEKGFLLARARAVMAESGIDTQFVREPSKRIWANFQNGVRNYCSPGWYRLPERTAWAQFSIPFHVDPPQTVVVGPSALAAVKQHDSLAALLADGSLSLGVVDGVSYGPALDAAIRGSRNQVVRRTVEPVAMARMVAAGRLSFMLMDREDLAWFQEHDLGLRGVVRVDFKDMPPGLERYIACSKDVSPDLMARINKSIELALKAEARKMGRKRR
ncbi:ABC transporter substrate-binding protein [Massilia sp. TS11]|uniref:substrate-binding periplasmic protein n=1 Tax=Massilia sp. TS11 TaxID=2908003 RepID=UPI001EDA3BFB|nr:transporter substrate-binding domain-containing protein [Massilia sp. TS11]MCG2585736.1 transporter substrate-binding domain-containing protein [Massilia sp. TS11]